MKLYGLLQVLGRKCLYYDTDSVLFVEKKDECSLQVGNNLGELTNEIDAGDYITKFVSTGPKSYAYHTEKGKEVCKVKGFTLNYRNGQILNLAVIEEIITGKNGSS